MKAIVLFSEGIDSPVAAYLMQKKGLEIIAVHFTNSEDPEELKKVRELAGILKIKKVITLPHVGTQKLISGSINTRLQCIICKRMMYRIAGKLAEKEKAGYLITGENLGQVASQTLDNLYVLSKASDLEILRPLLGFDKLEIMKIARDIRTYDISTRKSAPCAFAPKNPKTTSKVEDVEAAEQRMDVEEAVKTAVEDAKALELM